MSIWTTISEWCNTPATPCAVQWIEKENVAPAYGETPAKADETYVRVSVVEMMLARSRAWFRDLQPSVQGLTRCKFGDQSIELPSLAAPDASKFPDKAVLQNFRLLDLIVFRGNSIEITAALIAIAGDDKLAQGIAALANVASLLSAPISTALVAAGKVKDSIAMLAGDQSGVHLAYHNTFTAEPGASQLRCGYLAIVGAAPDALADAVPVVANDRLWLRTQTGTTPVGFDYLLLRFEVLPTRDDLQNFSDIASQRDQAIASVLHDPPDVADRVYRTALSTILLHRELTNGDRRVLATALKAELDGLRATLGTRSAFEPTVRTWTDVIGSLPSTRDHSPLKLDDFVR